MNTPASPLTEIIPPVLVIPAQPHEPNDASDPGKPDSARQLVLGLLFGVVFGFLLQKGGVAKYEVLTGQFFLTAFVVVKIILSASIVGMLGIFSLRALGLVELHVKPTRYAPTFQSAFSSVSGSACSATTRGPTSSRWVRAPTTRSPASSA